MFFNSLLSLETLRFVDENDNEDEIWLSPSYTKKIDTPESFDALISPEKLALLSLLKEVKPSPKRTCNYKTSNI